MKSWWQSANKSDLELGRPGRVGKVTPVETNTETSHNVHNEARGAQIVYHGISPWLIVLASIPGLVSLVGLMMFGLQTSATVGGIAATATNAKDIATMSERNAKLAQYQLEETLKQHHLEVPHE